MATDPWQIGTERQASTRYCADPACTYPDHPATAEATKPAGSGRCARAAFGQRNAVVEAGGYQKTVASAGNPTSSEIWPFVVASRCAQETN